MSYAERCSWWWNVDRDVWLALRETLYVLDYLVEQGGGETDRERRLRDNIGQFESDVAGVFRAEGDAFAAEAANFPDGPVDPARVNNAVNVAVAAGSDDLRQAAERAAGEAWLIGAEDMARQLNIDITFNLDDPAARAYIRRVGADLVTRVDDTTRARLRRLIEDGTHSGWNYNQIAQSIISEFGEMAVGRPQQHIDSRAHLIAVTELGNAFEDGSLGAARRMAQMGLEMEKKWLTVGDNRVSDGCRDNQAEGWIPLDQQFRSGHDRPLRFPGCRCTALYQRKRSSV